MAVVRKYSSDRGYYSPLEAGSIDGTDDKPHDHGIVRAMKASYEPSSQAVGRPEATLFVSHLHHSTTEEDLMERFGKFGTILTCRVVRDIVTGRSKSYAFIEYKHSGCAKDAYQEGHRTVLGGRELLVDYELERSLPGWKPRRLGGGFGGKKESGQLRFGGRDRPFKRPIQMDSVLLGSSHSRVARRPY